jgi:hypothetical protein
LRKQGLYLILAATLLPLLSCNKACQAGYENPNCSIEVRAQFENLYYTVTESRNQDSAYSYSATIIASPGDIRKVLLSNVANGLFVNNVVGITSSDTLTIAYQSPDSNGRSIQGRGILSLNVMKISYIVSYTDSLPAVHTQNDIYQSVWIHP